MSEQQEFKQEILGEVVLRWPPSVVDAARAYWRITDEQYDQGAPPRALEVVDEHLYSVFAQPRGVSPDEWKDAKRSARKERKRDNEFPKQRYIDLRYR